MKKIWWWVIGIAVFLLIGTLVLGGFGILRFAHSPMFAVGDRIRTFDRFDGYWSPRGGTHMGVTWGLPFMGILGSLLMFALPVGIIALIVAGVVLLVKSSTKPKTSVNPPEPLVCPQCGEEVLSDWKVCPHCGQPLEEEK